MQNDGRMPIFKDRFNELYRQLSNGSITEFAKKLDLSRQTVGFYLNGDRIPDIQTLLQICTRCKVSSDWLIGLSNESDTRQTVRSVCDYIGLSASTVNYLHYARNDSDDLSVGFYRKFFDSIIQIGASGLDAIPGYVLEAARAHIIASSSEEKQSHIGIENIISAISRKGNTYTIPASSAEDYFLMVAQEEISKALAEVIGRMEDDAIKQLDSVGRIDSVSLWTIDEDDFEPWYAEKEYGEEQKANGEHQED